LPTKHLFDHESTMMSYSNSLFFKLIFTHIFGWTQVGSEADARVFSTLRS
jgi:hypothetical protein